MSTRATRRGFLKRAAAVSAAVGFPNLMPHSVLARPGRGPPNEKILVGCIGVGGQGRYDMSGFLASKDARVVAVCDVKTDMREGTKQIVDKHYGNSDCTAYNAFRELVARTDIDVVLIASTDCWHVLHALAAVRAGKDVYVEKPLGVSIQENLALREALHRYGRIFQFGTQQRSSAQFRQAAELALNGRIGQLKMVRVSAPAGADQRSGLKTYTPEPVPEGFDYEMWLGPAPRAPFHVKRVSTPHWYHINDYSIGYVGGWGIHHVDIAQWGMGTELTGPVEVKAAGVFPTNDAICDNALNWDAQLRYANGLVMDFTSDGGRNRHGITFEGSEGWVYVNRETIEAKPASLLKEVLRPDERHLPVSTQHQQNLLDCVRTRAQPVSNIEVAVRSDTLCHLTDIAMRLGRPVQWDPKKEQFVNDPQATRRITRAMRAPWRL